MKKLLLYWGILISVVQLTYSQSSCPNSDFSMNNFTNWQGRTGTCCPINTPTLGIVATRHTIMTGAGTDPNTGNQLPVVCPGYTFSARLGNQAVSYPAMAEALSYQITVQADSSNALFFYNYAVVLEDPSHTASEQPRFELVVRDQFGNIIPCTSYLVSASGNMPGWQNNGTRRWKPWESVGVDLSPFIGQTVTIEMRTGDCSLGGHYGYAYIVAECRPMKLKVAYCYGNNTAVVTAPPGFASYQWSDGSTSQTTSVTNPVPGQTLTCQLVSVSGCTAQLVAELYQTIITPDFTADILCSNVQFSDSTNFQYGVADTYTWDFGDGNTSTQQHPNHTYATGGTYTVKLVAQSDNGCKDSIIKQITLDDVPDAVFTAPQVCGDSWSFTNSSIGNNTIVSNSWTFGDGSTSTLATPTHTFPDPNVTNVWNYNVQLVVTNDKACKDSLMIPITLFDIPVADYNFTPIICENGLANFTDSSFVGNTTITSWNWNLGNGNTSTLQNPTNIYATNGIYPVTLIVTTAQGCMDTITQNIDVGKVPAAEFPLPDACGVLITYADSTEDFGQPIVSWNWNFGDGSTSNIQHPIHLFPANGQYTVQLIATNSSGCADTVSKLVTAYDKPNADFSFDPACPGYPIQLYDQSSAIYDAITDFQWTLAPGVNVVTQNTSYTYNTSGYMPVTLTVGTAFGCRDTVTKNVYVFELPKPDFSVAPVCQGFITSFMNLSSIDTGTIAQYSYNLSAAGLGNYTTPAPNMVIPSWGTYNVTLTTTSNNNCVDSITKPVRVYANPVADFTIFPDNGCSPLQVNYSNASSIPEGQINQYYWDLHTGTSTDVNPTRTYGTGVYSIMLAVTSNFGCVDTIHKYNAVTVHPDPVASFTSTPKQNSVIEPSFQFVNESVGYSNSLWNLGDGTISYNANPFHIYSNTQTGHYDVGLLVTNEYGCKDSTSGRVYVYDDHVIYYPNTITMNEDAINETFVVYGTNIETAEMLIFNRWGEKVAHIQGWQLNKLEWNGLGMNGKLLKQDTYSVRLMYSTTGGKVYEKIGHVNILR